MVYLTLDIINRFNASTWVVLLLVWFSIVACSTESQQQSGCRSCHNLSVDTNHSASCTSCHNGNPEASNKELAHQNLLQQPAHPIHFDKNCGSCHEEIVKNFTHSSHMTLSNLTNTVRKGFGASTSLENFTKTPQVPEIKTEIELVDDLLRRRCFRCHLYSSGDSYPKVSHGTGCAACHLSFYEGSLQSHQFQKPSNDACTSCHYGNYVGFDYLGRFEHDYNVEYRTPYTTNNDYFRPYGVEYRQLTPDIHHSAGLVCNDCHSGTEIMGSKESTDSVKATCRMCHSPTALQYSILPAISKDGDDYYFTTRNGTKLILPVIKHPAHETFKDKATCQACHAQWTYNDAGKHFVRFDSDEVDIWENLMVQGSSQIETIVGNNSDFDKDEVPVEMVDQLSGTNLPGLWLKGFTLRRWEQINLGRNQEGKITTTRPMLDISVSWLDEDEELRFDNLKPKVDNQGYMPYAAHTIGPAGLFYKERLQKFLADEQGSVSRQ